MNKVFREAFPDAYDEEKLAAKAAEEETQRSVADPEAARIAAKPQGGRTPTEEERKWIAKEKQKDWIYNAIEEEVARVTRGKENYRIFTEEKARFEREWEKARIIAEYPHYALLTTDSPYEEVLAHYKLPFPLYPFQVRSVNELGYRGRSGLYYQPGTGKTITATAMALFHTILGMADRVVVIMPPILLDQWAKFLSRIPGVSVTVYRGSPAVRKKIELGNTLFTLVGLQIFKRDYERFKQVFGERTTVILDEAHSIKNVASDNFKKIHDFCRGNLLNLLTGTPLSTPEDAYAYIKLISPDTYRSKQQFMNIHVASTDFWGNVEEWDNLDMLAESMDINAHRVLIDDVIDELPDITYTPVFYSLDAAHQDLYQKLAREQLLLLEDGKIDATTTQRLYHALGQIICNWGHFAGDPSKRPACYDLIDQTLDELGPDGKLLIAASYRMTNRGLLAYLQKYNAVAAYGEQTIAQNKAAVETFVNDPACRVFVAQPTSAGIGLDGLQQVCRNGLVLEVPSARDFEQWVARLRRAGQHYPVHIRVAVAEGTLQPRQMLNLLDRDALVNRVIRNKQDLTDAIFGQ